MRKDDGERIDTVIIGGGQAGLASAYHMQLLGRACVVLEANQRIGDSWRKRWDSLRVFTPARYDSLPGWRFPAPGWSYPTKDEVADYLVAYARRFDFDVRTGTRVGTLTRDGDRFVVAADRADYEADNVIVASGGYQVLRVPPFAGELGPAIGQLHSSAYRNPTQLADGAVLIVGAGNSGAEIAVEAAAEHETWLSGRDVGQEPFRAGGLGDRLLTPPFWFLLNRVLTVDSRIGRRMRGELSQRGLPLARVRRRDLAAAGVRRVPRVVGVEEGAPLLEDGSTLHPATVVWCTGYANDFSWIDLPIFDDGGLPRHERGVVAEVPGLYFVGLFFMATAASSLIGGVERDAALVAHHIATHRQVAGSVGAESTRGRDGHGESVTPHECPAAFRGAAPRR